VVSRGVGEGPVKLPIGTRLVLRDYLAPGVVWRTGRSARVDEDLWSSVSAPVADRLREEGIRSMVASPIIVEGRLWGVVNASTGRGPFPAGTADRLADFTELVATAVGNAQSRADVGGADPRPRLGSDRPSRPGGGPGRVDRGQQPPGRRDADCRPAPGAAPLTSTYC